MVDVVMAYVIMAYVVMAYVVMAYVVLATVCVATDLSCTALGGASTLTRSARVRHRSFGVCRRPNAEGLRRIKRAASETVCDEAAPLGYLRIDTGPRRL